MQKTRKGKAIEKNKKRKKKCAAFSEVEEKKLGKTCPIGGTAPRWCVQRLSSPTKRELRQGERKRKAPRWQGGSELESYCRHSEKERNSSEMDSC